MKSPANRPLDPVRVRYVYDENAKEIGGFPVESEPETNLLIVKMKDSEAQFYLDQAAIGNKPFDNLSKRATVVVEQATGTGEPTAIEKADAEAAPKRK